MTRRLTLLDIATVVAASAILAGAAWVALNGPTGPIPMHFDIHGQPNRWGDRNELAGALALMAGALGVTAGGMSWFAARTEDPSRRRGLQIGQLVSLLAIVIVTAILCTTLAASGQGDIASGLSWGTTGLAVLILVIGAFLGRVGPNPVVGVRTPWSYKSRLAWDRSNRLAGRLFFGLGLAGLFIGPFLPLSVGMPILIVAILIAAFWSAFESWRVWRTDPDRQPF